MTRFRLVLFGALITVGCGGGGGGSMNPPTITAVVVSGDSTVALAGTRQLTATAMAGGTPVSNGVTFQWTSSDTTRSTVSSAGLVSGVRLGSANVTAQAVLNGTATGVVSGAHAVRTRIASIAVTPASPLSLNFVGDTQRFAAEPRDAAGTAVPGLTITWSANNAALSVAATGLATAVARSSQGGIGVRVRATADGVTDSSVTILVRQIPVLVSLNPNSFPTLTSLGQQIVAGCVALDSANDTIPSHPCGWSVTGTDSGVVTFNPTSGATTNITARKNGDASIRATAFAGLFGPNVVQVRQAAARVKLHPTTLDTSRIVITTGTMQVIDSVFDANDSLVRNPAPIVTWTATSAAASVDANGFVTAGGSAGNTFIKAVSGTGKDSVRIEVVATAITLSGDVQPLLTARCVSCHDGGGTTLPGVQDLRATHTFASIVSAQALESGLKRALPQVPDSSYLVHKIQGTHLVPPANGSGVRMPQTGPLLTKGEINAIRNWILQGAQNN
jgi:hypothetical protein